MGIEIREMVIQGKVDKSGKAPAADEKKGAGKSADSEKVVGKISYALRRQLIDDCVQEVLEKINKRLEL